MGILVAGVQGAAQPRKIRRLVIRLLPWTFSGNISWESTVL